MNALARRINKLPSRVRRGIGIAVIIVATILTWLVPNWVWLPVAAVVFVAVIVTAIRHHDRW